jgi:hypothetical protein
MLRVPAWIYAVILAHVYAAKFQNAYILLIEVEIFDVIAFAAA